MSRSGSNPTQITTDGSFDSRFASTGRITAASTAASSGDNTIITPTSGARLRVFWVGLSVASTDEVIAIVKFGAGGTAKYKWNLGAFMHWETIEGATDEALVVNLSAAISTNVNVTYEEF